MYPVVHPPCVEVLIVLPYRGVPLHNQCHSTLLKLGALLHFTFSGRHKGVVGKCSAIQGRPIIGTHLSSSLVPCEDSHSIPEVPQTEQNCPTALTTQDSNQVPWVTSSRCVFEILFRTASRMCPNRYINAQL